MNAQPLGQTGARILQRRDLTSEPLGAVDKKRFEPQQGGTTPVSPPARYRTYPGHGPACNLLLAACPWKHWCRRTE